MSLLDACDLYLVENPALDSFGYAALLVRDGRGGGYTQHSRGTGALARELAMALEQRGVGRSLGVTRRQSLVDPRIPYTSHNSAAGILLETDQATADPIAEVATTFLIDVAAPGSDAGLCVAGVEQVPGTVVDFGRRAKREILTKGEADRTAHEVGIHLRGHTGERIGVIGILAAAGLRHSGEDGRFLEITGLRDLRGIQPAGILKIESPVLLAGVW
ncbi:MAG: hypothetical protein M1118_05825 [Chloroflexi bacterium]|nr:hypothetical protein [Chloroflexota bacterium]